MLAYRGSVAEGDSVATLESLLERARRGEIKGIVYGVFTSAKEIEIGFVGSALDNPLESLGILPIMEAELSINFRRTLKVV